MIAGVNKSGQQINLRAEGANLCGYVMVRRSDVAPDTTRARIDIVGSIATDADEVCAAALSPCVAA